MVALHEPRSIGHPRTSEDVRHIIDSLSVDRRETLEGFIYLFKERIENARRSCAHVATALSERENVVSAPALSSARQLVQRGLFDRRAENASLDRARTNAAVLEEAAHRVDSLASWSDVTPSLKLHAILLVTDLPR
jgi:hypothetical protein